jgi:hypothetical protein
MANDGLNCEHPLLWRKVSGKGRNKKNTPTTPLSETGAGLNMFRIGARIIEQYVTNELMSDS